MPKKIVSSEIEDSGFEVLAHAAKIVAAIKAALADGFQPGQDLPVGVVAAVAEFPAIVQNAQNVTKDFAEDKVLFIKGANLGAYEVIDALVK